MAEGWAALDGSIATMLARLATVGGCLDDVVKLIYLITALQLRDAVDPHVMCLWAGAADGLSDARIAGPSHTVGTETLRATDDVEAGPHRLSRGGRASGWCRPVSGRLAGAPRACRAGPS